MGCGSNSTPTERLRGILALVCALVVASGAVAAQSIDGALRRFVRSPGVVADGLGVCVLDLETGAVIARHQPARPLIPASNMKLVTAMAACEFLGEQVSFSTRLIAAGTVTDGVLAGDLALVGDGDPRFGGPGAADVDAFAARVVDAGIRRVTGDIVVVEQRIDRDYYHPDWAERYAAADRTAREVAALGHGENVVGIVVRGGASVGAPGRISLLDDAGLVRIINKTRTVPRGRSGPGSIREWDSNVVTVRGDVPLGGKIIGSAAVHDPPARVARLLERALAERGVRIDGSIRRADHGAAPAGRELARNRTTLDEMLGPTLERSDNRYAEILFKAAGAAMTQAVGSFEVGGYAARAVIDRARAAHDPEGTAPVGDEVAVRDGSGLSRHNRLAAIDIARALRWAYGRPWGARFLGHLPHGAQRGSTLRRRFRRSPVAEHLLAKTGYLYNVRALSGYLRVGDRRVLVFSVLMNDLSRTSPRARRALDAFIEGLWRAARG